MKYDKEKFEKEFNQLMDKDSIIYDPETGEWRRKAYSYVFGEEADDIIITPDDPEYSILSDTETTEAEQELGDDLAEARENFRDRLFKCLDIFLEDTAYKFFEAFRDVCLSLNALWKISSYDADIQQAVFSFLREIDENRTDKVVYKLCFCMYLNSECWETKAELLTELILSEEIKNCPYPGYFEHEASFLINELGELSGEDSARLERDYPVLTGSYLL